MPGPLADTVAVCRLRMARSDGPRPRLARCALVERPRHRRRSRRRQDASRSEPLRRAASVARKTARSEISRRSGGYGWSGGVAKDAAPFVRGCRNNPDRRGSVSASSRSGVFPALADHGSRSETSCCRAFALRALTRRQRREGIATARCVHAMSCGIMSATGHHAEPYTPPAPANGRRLCACGTRDEHARTATAAPRLGTARAL